MRIDHEHAFRRILSADLDSATGSCLSCYCQKGIGNVKTGLKPYSSSNPENDGTRAFHFNTLTKTPLSAIVQVRYFINNPSAPACRLGTATSRPGNAGIWAFAMIGIIEIEKELRLSC